METILTLLKFDLGILHDVRDAYFNRLLEAAKEEIERRGITLDMNSADDQMLLSDYAAWIYRKRQEDVPLANNIQHRLRNRIIKERVAKQDATL